MKEQWKEAYRLARILHEAGIVNTDALAKLRPLQWRAWLVITYKRNRVDVLSFPLSARIEAHKVVSELLQNFATYKEE